MELIYSNIWSVVSLKYMQMFSKEVSSLML